MRTRTILLLSAVGLTAGAGAAYFLDPRYGRRRRRRTRAAAEDLVDTTRRRGRKAWKKARNSTRDAVVAVNAAAARMPWNLEPAERLLNRLQAIIERHVSFPGAISFSAEAGRVTLSGPILAEEAEKLIRAVSRIPGVEELVDDLDLRYRRNEDELTIQKGWWPPNPRALVGAGSAIGAVGLGLATRALMARR